MIDFNKSKGILRCIIVWTLAVSFLRAIRLPNDFSEAHWLLDYRFGFIRRGFIGSFLSLAASLFEFKVTPSIIIGLSTVVFGSFCAVLLVLLFRLLGQHNHRSGIYLWALVFASSPFPVINAHLFGYFDTLLYVLTIISIVAALSDRPYLAALFSIIGILTHESYLLIGTPLVCLASFLFCKVNHSKSTWTHHIFGCGLQFLAFLFVFMSQALIDHQNLRKEFQGYLGSFNFIDTRSNYVAFQLTTRFYVSFLKYSRYFDDRLLNPLVLSTLTPTLITVLFVIHSSFRIRPFSFFSIIVLGIISCPVIMLIIAWDEMRISNYTIGGAFIIVWLLGHFKKAHPINNLFLLLAIPTLVLNIFWHIPLMDGEIDRFSYLQRLIFYAPTLLSAMIVIRRDNRKSRDQTPGKESSDLSHNS